LAVVIIVKNAIFPLEPQRQTPHRGTEFSP